MTDEQVKIINNAITQMLSRREHSQKELRKKLQKKGLDPELSEIQLKKFVANNVQSDARFAEMLIRSRANKGQGLNRIKLELNEHQIDSNFIHETLQELDIDWFDLARKVALKKYSGSAAKDWAEQQKRQRFMQYRGFTQEQIKYALENE